MRATTGAGAVLARIVARMAGSYRAVPPLRRCGRTENQYNAPFTRTGVRVLPGCFARLKRAAGPA